MGKRNKLKKALSPVLPANMASTNDDDDQDLMNDLLAQLDSRDEIVQQESANVLNEMNLNQQANKLESKQDAKSRFKARQARKAASLAQSYSPDDPATEARLQKEAKDEERDIKRVCDELGLEIHEINPDGHCLFSAVADQLQLLSILPPSQASYAIIRAAASTYIFTHPDDFLPFLPSAGGEDGAGALDAGLMSPQEFERYCVTIRDTGVWGGEPEILALSRAYRVPIHVIQGGRPSVVVHNPAGSLRMRRLWISGYHRRMYGLGEHYNSLRPKSHSLLPNALQNILQ
ncbi:hypothetical protein C8J57DRAFT_1051385 [Mycena rebaudengoi]|nr:hypothetical protein C8J57DRAFT_1051385 [Mycena rebaudengoi]